MKLSVSSTAEAAEAVAAIPARATNTIEFDLSMWLPPHLATQFAALYPDAVVKPGSIGGVIGGQRTISNHRLSDDEVVDAITDFLAGFEIEVTFRSPDSERWCPPEVTTRYDLELSGDYVDSPTECVVIENKASGATIVSLLSP